MGQRHQVYIVVKDGDETKVHGIHHQWLYGRQAIQMLGNALKLNAKSGEYGPFRRSAHNASEALAAVYSLDVSEGYYHQTHVLEDGETLDPRTGDNNDGITIIDFRGRKPKYCFMNLGSGDTTIMKAPALTPLTAEQYVRLYYPTNETWYESYEKHRVEIEKEIAKKLKPLSRYGVLTIAEVKAIFPEMFEDHKSSVEAA